MGGPVAFWFVGGSGWEADHLTLHPRPPSGESGHRQLHCAEQPLMVDGEVGVAFVRR